MRHLPVDDLLQPPALHVLRHIVGVLPGGQGAGAFAVLEHVGHVVADLVHQAQRVGMVFLRFPAEPGDQVGADGRPGQDAADGGDAVQVPGAVVAAVHALQHAAAAALHRQVDVLADVRVRGHHLQHLVGHVLRVAGAEAHAQQGIHPGHQGQQVGEVRHRLCRVLHLPPAVHVPAVTVHVLAQQGHLPVALGHQVAGLLHDGLRVAAAFPPPGEGHHAEGAHVVAAPHDADEGGDPVAAQAHRCDVVVGLVAAQQHVHGLLAGAHLVQQLGKRAISIRAHHQVHELLLLQQVLPHALGHAAQYTELQVRIPSLQVLQPVDAVQHRLLGLVPDAARVQQHQVGLLGPVRRGIAFLRQDARDDLAVAEVHLAAVALDIDLSSHGTPKGPRRYGDRLTRWQSGTADP